MKRKLTIALAVSMIAISPVAIAAESYLPVIEEAPQFSLTNVNGAKVRSAQLRGSVIVLTFMYTHCSSLCPLVTEKMKKIADRLGTEGLLGHGARLVSISFDPARDTPRWLKTYSESAEVDPSRWMFLSGTPDQTATLLKQYDFAAIPEPTGDYEHVSRIYLIDSGGRIRQIYSMSFLDAGLVVRDVKSLIAIDKATPAVGRIDSNHGLAVATKKVALVARSPADMQGVAK
jgi:protein SCO1/2